MALHDDDVLSNPQVVAIPIPVIEGFEEKVVYEAARQMLRRLTPGYDGADYENEVDTPLARRIETHVVEEIKQQAREAAPVVALQLLEDGVRLVNRYGDTTGDRVSFKTIVADEIVKELRAYGNRKAEGIFHKIIKEEIEVKFRAEVAGVISEAKAPIVEALRAQVEDLFESALRRALDGKS